MKHTTRFDDLNEDDGLPSGVTAVQRIFGDRRPKQSPPHRAPIVARFVDNSGRFSAEYKVYTNRTGNSWWFVYISQGTMLNYARTTSKRIAGLWIDAINRMAS